MAIVLQYVFGSHARGDYHDRSDMDILAVVDDNIFSSFNRGKLNFSFYPKEKFIEDAKDGNLFVMHIVREAVVTYDPSGLSQAVANSFVYRTSYETEIRKASDLGWFLVRQSIHFQNKSLVNRRISWCVRTILIARTVEENAPAFSPGELSAYANKPYVADLLSLKERAVLTDQDIESMRKFLIEFGRVAPLPIMDDRLKEPWMHFIKTRNSIGIKTISQMEIDVIEEFYM